MFICLKRKEYILNGNEVSFDRLTYKWLELQSVEVLTKVLRSTADRKFAAVEEEIALFKCIYVVLPTSLLEFMSSDQSHLTQQEYDNVRAAMKIGYATGLTKQLMLDAVYSRYKTCMDLPHMLCIVLRGLRLYEIRAIEANLLGG